MSDSHFLNFKKSKFSHQVTLVSKDHFILKSLIQLPMAVISNLHNLLIL